MGFTENQQKAIDVNKGNFLISAGAGSGKTSVLSNRVVRLLTQGDDNGLVPVDKIIVATFTKAASLEMIQRIGEILTHKIQLELETLMETEDEIEKHTLQQKIEFYELQKLKLPNAKISTIDALCANLVRENFQTLGLSSDIKTATQVELNLLKKEISQDVLESYYAHEDEAKKDEFLELVEFVCIKNDNALEKMLLASYDYIRSFPYPFDYLDDVLELYNNGEIKSEWEDLILNHIKEELSLCVNLTKKAINLTANCECINDENFAYVKIQELFNNGQYKEAIKTLKELEFKTFSFPKGEDNKDLCKSYRDQSKAIAQSLVNKYSTVFEEFDNDMQLSAKIITIFFEVLKEYYTKLEAKKQELEIMDFANLEHFALDLLSSQEKDENGNYTQSDVAKSLSMQYEYIFVDECQDINKVQNSIFNLLSQNENNIYMVGDVKQSIYRFRKASPEIFIQKKIEKENSDDLIILQENFRSRNEVCDVINHIFKQLMSNEIGDIDYTDDQHLICANENYEDTENLNPEFHLIYNSDKTINKRELESRHIALKIQEMIDNKYQVQGENGLRDCEYKDFAILLRKKQEIMEIYQNSLHELSIPTTCKFKTSFFDEYDVMVALNLLKIINNPLNDIALLSVVMSPLFGFSPDEVSKIKLEGKTNKLWLSFAKTENDFLDLIAVLRKKASTLSMPKLLQYIYDKTDFLTLMSSKNDLQASKVDANMKLLLNATKDYESFNKSGLSGFMNYVTRLIEISVDLEPITPPTMEFNTVKIMTIHESKGLEYPICILADISKPFNKSDTNTSNYLFDTELGFSMKMVNHHFHSRYNPLGFQAIKLKLEKDNISEELRALYVALTRAREKLIMVGTIETPENISEKILELTPRNVFVQNNYRNWLIPALLRGLENSPEFENLTQEIKDYKKPSKDKDKDKDKDKEKEKEKEKFYPDKKVLFQKHIESSNVEFNLINGIALFDVKDDEVEASSVDDVDNVEETIFVKYEELIAKIKNQMSKVYNQIELTKTPAKSTVTKLAKENHAKENENFYIKLKTNLVFNKAETKSASKSKSSHELTAAQKGTILHTFMQYADFNNAQADLENEIQQLVSKEYLSEVEAKNLNKESIEKFFKSTTYTDRLIKAGNTIEREFMFNFFIDAKKVNENLPEDDTNEVFVQGIADCVVIDSSSNITIVDYKTDRVHENEEIADYKNRLSEQYKQQMVLYSKALDDIFGIGKVTETCLYSLAIGEEIQIDFKS